MKHKLITNVLAFLFLTSLALAQIDIATGTSTNDDTMARLRMDNCVFGSPKASFFINGEIALAGSQPQTHISPLRALGWTYLTPGTYSVTVAPTDKGLEAAMLEPVDVTVEAGHRYTFVVMGQLDDANHQALVIDDTAAYEGIDAKPTDYAHITINNLKGVASLNYYVSGMVRDEDVPFGGFKAAFWPEGAMKGVGMTISGTSEELFSGPATDYLGYAHDSIDCAGGT